MFKDADVRIARSIRRAELRISNMDDSVSSWEVTLVMATAAGIKVTDVRASADATQWIHMGAMPTDGCSQGGKNGPSVDWLIFDQELLKRCSLVLPISGTWVHTTEMA